MDVQNVVSDKSGLLQILEHLFARIDGIEEVAIFSEGKKMPLMQIPKDKNASGMAILNLVAIADEAPMGNVKEVAIKCRNRFLAFYRIDTAAVLGIYGKSSANFGLLDSGCRSAIEKIREVIKKENDE